MLLHSLFSAIAAMALIHTGCPSADVRAIRPARRDEPVTATVTQPADVPEPKPNGVFGLFELDWATPGASVASVLGGDQGENEDDADFGGFCRIGEQGTPFRMERLDGAASERVRERVLTAWTAGYSHSLGRKMARGAALQTACRRPSCVSVPRRTT